MKALKLLASSLVGFSLCGASVAALPMEEQSRMVPNLRPKEADYLNYLKIEPLWQTKFMSLGASSLDYIFRDRPDMPFVDSIVEPLYRDYWRWNGFDATEFTIKQKAKIAKKFIAWGKTSAQNAHFARTPVSTDPIFAVNHFDSGYDIKEPRALTSGRIYDKLRLLLAINETYAVTENVYRAVMSENLARAELMMILKERPESVAKLYQRYRKNKMTSEYIDRSLLVSPQYYGFAAALYQAVDLLKHYGCTTEVERMEKAFRLEGAYVATEEYMANQPSFKDIGAYGDSEFTPLPRYKYIEESWDKGFVQFNAPGTERHELEYFKIVDDNTENDIHDRYSRPQQKAIVKSISSQCRDRLDSF